jgi:hypothetical protein
MINFHQRADNKSRALHKSVLCTGADRAALPGTRPPVRVVFPGPAKFGEETTPFPAAEKFLTVEMARVAAAQQDSESSGAAKTLNTMFLTLQTAVVLLQTQTFPGVFTGIGGFSIHKELVSSKIAGGAASLTDPVPDRRTASPVGRH